MEASSVAQVTLAPMTLYYPEQCWAHHGSRQCRSSHTGANDFALSGTMHIFICMHTLTLCVATPTHTLGKQPSLTQFGHINTTNRILEKRSIRNNSKYHPREN
jgi:hypothetical protein